MLSTLVPKYTNRPRQSGQGFSENRNFVMRDYYRQWRITHFANSFMVISSSNPDLTFSSNIQPIGAEATIKDTPAQLAVISSIRQLRPPSGKSVSAWPLNRAKCIPVHVVDNIYSHKQKQYAPYHRRLWTRNCFVLIVVEA